VISEQHALKALRQGLVVAAATETFFGLLADARQTAAIDRVFLLKGRAEGKGIALLLPGREAWGSLVTEIPPAAGLLANRFWPGPLTIALPARSDVDPRLTVDGKVAVRWAGDSTAARLARAFGAPLTATSANLTGEPACATHEEVVRAFSHARGGGERPKGWEDLLIVEGRAAGGSPSTLVEITGDRVRILRQGRVSHSALAAVVPGVALG
jgi:L-threonylcarbamoyladenylate synthase